ncbi:hypothetical protein PVNG_06144 [Plasmodium vivax North Korean]|uniref:Uncharacterized protein n=1 Tax=Plasmodium vivax North Korean TaxID=1035514 RepID=A0A0J9TMS4_PLAVI|nr:hypothetical protein PVNG_06144 [Plasmodium vivax North Korean]
MKSWDNAIKALWDMLKKEYPTSNNNGKPWCDKYPIELKTIYPVALTSPNCNESIPQEIISTNCPLLSVKEECVCPQNSVHEIPLQPVQAPETDRTKNLAVTSVYPNGVLVQKARYE